MQVNRVGGVPTAATTPLAGRQGFGEMLAQAIESVSRQELEAQRQGLLLAAGEVEDIHTVTIAAQKAELALELTIAMRNKVLEAYQEIMRMPV